MNGRGIGEQGEAILLPAAGSLDVPLPQRNNAPERVKALTVRAIVIAALLTFVAAKWFQLSEVVLGTCMVSESVPPIPAVAALLFLTALLPISTRLLGKRSLSRAEAMFIFAMMVPAITVMGYGGLSYLFGFFLTFFYYATPANKYADFHKYIPVWFNPRRQDVVNEYFEGSYTGVTPWMVWLPYLLLWGAFFLVLFFTMMCLVRVFYDYWARQERLTFPIVQMATALGYATSSQEGQPPFFRNPLTWFGLGVAFLFNGTNMIKAFNPDFPALGMWYPLTGILRERPWSAIGDWYFRWDPSLTGMGYLMSADVLLSAVVGFFFRKGQSILATAVGYNAPFPSREAESAGAYLVLFLLLVWGARRYLWQSLRRDLASPTRQEPVSPPPRWAVRGAAVGFLLLGAFFLACKVTLRRQGGDLALWVIAAFMFLFFAFALVYARIRAESGAPMSWLYPWGAHQYFLYNFIGTKRIVAASSANPFMLAQLWFISRGFFQSHMGVQVENFRIADVTGADTTTMAWAQMIGLIIGLVCGMFFLMSAYYNYGMNILWMHTGDYPYQEAIKRFNDPGAADPQRVAWILATLIGTASTAALALARRAFFRFPLHPLGLAMGLAYGEPLWGPFFLAWVCKVVILRTGGMRLYRRFIPLFLGAVIGHYLTAGIIWGLLGISQHQHPAFSRYKVWFG